MSNLFFGIFITCVISPFFGFHEELNSVLLYLSGRNPVHLGSVLKHTGGIQKPSGHSPWHLSLGGPAQLGGLNKITSRGPFQYQPFCDCSVSQKFLIL